MSLLALALAAFAVPGAGEAAATSPAATFLDDGALLALGSAGPGGRTGHAVLGEVHGVLLAAWYAPVGVRIVWGRVLGILCMAGALGSFSLALRRAGADPAGLLLALFLAALTAPALLAAATIHPAAPAFLLVCLAVVLHLRWRDTREDKWMLVAHTLLALATLIEPAALAVGVAGAVAITVGEHDRVSRGVPIVFVLPWVVALGVAALTFHECRGDYDVLVRAWLTGETAVPAGGFVRTLPGRLADGRWFDVALSLASVVTALAGCVDFARTRGSRRVLATFGFGCVAAFLLAAPSVLDPAGAWLLPGIAFAVVPALANVHARRNAMAWCLLAPLLLVALGIADVVHTVVRDPRHGPIQSEVERPVVELEMRRTTVTGPPEIHWALGFDRRVIRGLHDDPAAEFVFTSGTDDPGPLRLAGDEYPRVRDGQQYDVYRRIR